MRAHHTGPVGHGVLDGLSVGGAQQDCVGQRRAEGAFDRIRIVRGLWRRGSRGHRGQLAVFEALDDVLGDPVGEDQAF